MNKLTQFKPKQVAPISMDWGDLLIEIAKKVIEEIED